MLIVDIINLEVNLIVNLLCQHLNHSFAPGMEIWV